MAIKDLDRQRAEFAFNCVKNFIEQNEDKERQKKYRGYIRNTPSLMLNHGLGGTLAFMFSKRKKNDGEVYNIIAEHIYDWIIKDENKYLLELDTQEKAQDKLEELMNKVILLSSSEYRMLTNEVLALFAWLKRFVEGLVDGEEMNGD